MKFVCLFDEMIACQQSGLFQTVHEAHTTRKPETKLKLGQY